MTDLLNVATCEFCNKPFQLGIEADDDDNVIVTKGIVREFSLKVKEDPKTGERSTITVNEESFACPGCIRDAKERMTGHLR